ncbi:hypothetical protein PVL29_024741 [Vitis rotundifolia]|uniref:Uncharacterized protein n=1 Tax=Vitis rotundifolia TaxID=103349 RepID=A0AA38YSK9_VITRO|nr:hypothetical protein PVL29_024741 [Vitis rotundifolia]
MALTQAKILSNGTNKLLPLTTSPSLSLEYSILFSVLSPQQACSPRNRIPSQTTALSSHKHLYHSLCYPSSLSPKLLQNISPPTEYPPPRLRCLALQERQSPKISLSRNPKIPSAH